MSEKDYASRKAYQSEVRAKSSGESALNEDQIPAPYQWQHSTDRKSVIVSAKEGYLVASGPFQLGPSIITSDMTITDDGFNYMSIGPIEIAAGVTVTIDGGSWVIV